jgi:CheY-like chemotaxis protein
MNYPTMISTKLDKILCVNDNDITLFVLKRALDKAGFSDTLITYSNGYDAFQYCTQLLADPSTTIEDYPHIIFLDLQMPLMDGWEFLEKFSKELWHDFPETRIIITSDSIDQDDSVRARAYPFVFDFMRSPISIDYLKKLHVELLQDSQAVGEEQ